MASAKGQSVLIPQLKPGALSVHIIFVCDWNFVRLGNVIINTQNSCDKIQFFKILCNPYLKVTGCLISMCTAKLR